MKNPFGAFYGLSFSVTFAFRTLQEPVRERVVLAAENGRPMPGVVRELNFSAAGGDKIQPGGGKRLALVTLPSSPAAEIDPGRNGRR
jgi:hypothetical protein